MIVNEYRIDMQQDDFITIISSDGNSIKGVYTDQHGEDTKFDIIGDMFLSENSLNWEVRQRIIQAIKERKIEEIEDVSVKNLLESFNLFNESILESINNPDLFELPFEMDSEISAGSKEKILNAIHFTENVIGELLDGGVQEGESEIDVLHGLINDYKNYVEDVLENGQEKEFYMLVQEWMAEEQ